MAPRRGRNTKIINNLNYNNLCIDDVLCPICRTVLTQPVTLPCNHGFCYSCFEGTMQNANLACPLCRIRIGSWYRIAKKENRLINQELWNILREKFSKQLENKSKGIEEETTLEEINVSISTPGEIRREYELEKKKEEAEIRKEREAEQKASEEFIAKIRKEEKEYEEAVKEEKLKKLKLDAEIAKKLSQEWLKTPSRKGTLDSYFKKDTAPLKIVTTPKMHNFATKEYTCRVLCLDRDSSTNQPSTSKGFCGLPVLQKKIQQLQKIVVNVDSSDSSDCIESECRYFKPIDYRHNPPSAGKTPVKVPTRRAVLNNSANIISPSGEINFQSNILESAFARISNSYCLSNKNIKSNNLPYTCIVTEQDNKNSSCEAAIPNKRKGAPQKESPSKRKKEEYINSKSKRQLFESDASSNFVENTSPKFYGFDSSAINSKKNKNIKKNNLSNAKLVQEKADFEFAMKLQEEFDKSSQYSTRSQISSTRRSRRQITLDEIVSNTYKVK